MNPKTLLLNKRKTQCTANEKKQARIIANHYKKQFKKDKPPRPNLEPTQMKIPFSKEKISIVIINSKTTNVLEDMVSR